MRHDMLDQTKLPLVNRLKYSARVILATIIKRAKIVADYFIIEPDAKIYSGTGVTFLNNCDPRAFGLSIHPSFDSLNSSAIMLPPEYATYGVMAQQLPTTTDRPL